MKIDYKKINSYHKLIEIMKALSNEEKLIFVYNYFYREVDYNYFEWLYGFLSYGVVNFDLGYDNYTGEINKSGNTITLCYIRNLKFTGGDSTFYPDPKEELILQKIIDIRNKYNLNIESDVEKYKEEIIRLIHAEYINKIKNRSLRKLFSKILKEEIIKRSFVPVYINDKEYLFDITWMIFENQKDNAERNGYYHNGLLRNGVCRHYASFTKKVLSKLGFNITNVVGKSGLIHEWNMIIIGNEIRFIDMAREIHLRNKIKNYNYKKGDWFLITIEDLFKLEPERDIREINGIKLDTYITKDNYMDYIHILYNSFNTKENTKTL